MLAVTGTLSDMTDGGCHEAEYFCTDLYIADGVEDRQFIPAMVMGDAPIADSVGDQRSGRRALRRAQNVQF